METIILVALSSIVSSYIFWKIGKKSGYKAGNTAGFVEGLKSGKSKSREDVMQVRPLKLKKQILNEKDQSQDIWIG